MIKRAKHLLIAGSALLALADMSYAATWAHPELLLLASIFQHYKG